METADHNINVNVVCPGTVWTDMMAGLAAHFGMETEEAKENFYAGHLFKDREIARRISVGQSCGYAPKTPDASPGRLSRWIPGGPPGLPN